MNILEEITRLVMRIRDLKAAIHEAGEERASLRDKAELAYLRGRLERMKQKLLKEA